MVEKYTLLIGLNDKDSKKQELDEITAYKLVMSCIAPYTDGATIYKAYGYYKHEDGTMIQENSLHAEVLFFDEAEGEATKKTRKIVNLIKSKLNQESVAVTYSIVQSDLW